jgi:hypothetical protein
MKKVIQIKKKWWGKDKSLDKVLESKVQERIGYL